MGGVSNKLNSFRGGPIRATANALDSQSMQQIDEINPSHLIHQDRPR